MVDFVQVLPRLVRTLFAMLRATTFLAFFFAFSPLAPSICIPVLVQQGFMSAVVNKGRVVNRQGP